ncbi:serine/threonine kinase [Aureococcus anophagefferens]|nr:serine/threonine kinase [Aureococcus anophagefferens]
MDTLTVIRNRCAKFEHFGMLCEPKSSPFWALGSVLAGSEARGRVFEDAAEKRDDVVGLVRSKLAPRDAPAGFVGDPHRTQLPQAYRAKYATLGVLGTGATSIVHLCRLKRREGDGARGLFSGGKARGSGEPEFRAVKVCRKRPAWRQGNDETFAQLRREITALRLLDHPNVLRSYEDFEDATHYLFVMEYAAGGELFERLSKVGSFSERTAANLTRDVASALAHCHANGVIHRDMKLENLLLPTPLLRNVKLADFGMAHSDRGITTTLCGTPGFIAPEQRTGRPYGAKVDVWGLGCVLYIMLSGMEPFDAAEDEQAFERSDAGRGAAGARFAPRFEAWRDRSSRSKDLLAKCLTVDPDERIDAATILDHPFVRDGGRKNSYIGPSTTDKIGSLVKQRRLSGGRAPPSLSAVVSADDDAPSSSAGSSPDDVVARIAPPGDLTGDDDDAALALHLAAATAASMSAETPDLGLRALDDGAAAGGDDSPERPTATRASTATRGSPEPPSSPVSDASGLDASLHGLEPPDASAVDAMGRDVVELDLASIDLASNGAIRRFPSHDKYGLDADRVFDPAAHRSVPLDQ